mmetsp:Transcript_16597/g.34180  ORF Transcript_16597/g.34180 Transcript_16597/m.34180 type:complete len:271 (-) Transcript_16597:837-1649(-)
MRAGLKFRLEVDRVVPGNREVRLVVDTVVSILPSDNLVTPVSDFVAKCLHGEDREGFFHLRGKFLDTKHKETQNGSGWDHHDMVPRLFKRLVKSKREEGEPNKKESGNVTVVENWNGTGKKTFAGSKIILKDGEGLVHLILSDEVHGELFNGQRKIEESTVGSVRGVKDCLSLLGFKSLEEFGLEVFLVFPFRGQVTLHGSDKGPGALGEPVEVSLALLGGGLGIVVEGGSHAHKVAGVVDVHSPVLSGLVPSLIGLVGAEDQQQTQKGG